MPLFFANLAAFFVAVIAPLALRVLAALGIGAAVYSGIDATTTALSDYAIAQVNGLPADIFGIVGLMKIDVALNIIVSSITIKMTLAGLTGGSIKKFIHK